MASGTSIWQAKVILITINARTSIQGTARELNKFSNINGRKGLLTVAKAEILFSRRHNFTPRSCMDSIALTCRGGANLNDGGVGFDQSDETIALRAALLSSWSPAQRGVGAEHGTAGVFWRPALLKTGQWWRLFVKCDRGSGMEDVSNISDEFLSVAKRHNFDRKSAEMVGGFSRIAKQNECCMMYWPHLTDYWSIGYIFSDFIDKVTLDVSEICQSFGHELHEVYWQEMPVH